MIMLLLKRERHGGMDYGSGAAPTGYNRKYDFGFSVAIGGATGSNCSFDDVQMNGNVRSLRSIL